MAKLVALPDDQAARHWTKETRAFLFNAAWRYLPSIRRDFDHDKLWSDACRLAAEDLRGWAPGAALAEDVPVRAG